MARQSTLHEMQDLRDPLHTEPMRNLAISQEEIAKRAFEIFLSRGEGNGHHEEDWYQAERELRTSRRRFA